MAVIVSKELKVPALAKMLSDFAHGEIVKLNENGVPVEFYVAKHDYESGLNGSGRTLLVRKDCYDKGVWNNSDLHTYASSAIDTFFNSTYKSLHDVKVQNAMGTTTFYYTPGNGNSKVTSLSRSIFALSYTEFGFTSNNDTTNVEGSMLPIATSLRSVELNGSVVYQWTRSPRHTNPYAAMYVTPTGESSAHCTTSYGRRPCFTLPSTTLFDANTLIFKEVA